MRQSTSVFIAVLLLSVFAAVQCSIENPPATLLGESRVADIFICIRDLLKAKTMIKDVQTEFQLKEYVKAIEGLKVLVLKVDNAVEKCAKGTCWMEGQQRCENETNGQCEKWGLIWYPVCKPGYHNNLCCICSQDCPNGFRDDGFECGKPSSYGRGVGYPWKFGDALNLDKARQRCEKANPQLGCEKYGAIIYPKCKEGFHNVGCCVCSPDCPSETTDIGVSCQKKTYGRGVGFVEGKCIEENWDDFKPIDVLEKCVDQAEDIAVKLQQIMDNIDNNNHKIQTIKYAYQLLQYAGPFLSHCIDPLLENKSQ